MNTSEILNIGNRFKEAGASGNKAHVVASQGKWIVLRDGSPKETKYDYPECYTY